MPVVCLAQSQAKAGALSASNGPSIVITAEALGPEDSGCLPLNASHAQGGSSGVEGAAAPGCWLLRDPTTDDGYLPTVSAGEQRHAIRAMLARKQLQAYCQLDRATWC